MEDLPVFENRMFIYLYPDGKKHTYLLLDKDYINNGSLAEGRHVVYDTKFGGGRSGVMYEIEATESGSKIKYGKVNVPHGIWQNRSQVVLWQAKEKAILDVVKLQKDALTDRVALTLEPLRVSYSSLKNRQERAVFIARIIDYIMK